MPITLQPLAAEVAYELAPLLARDDENGNVGALFLAVLNAPIELVAGAVREGEDESDGFSVFMDLERAPAIGLPWLLQFKGVRATPGLAENDAREEGRKAEGLHRGTITSMQKAGAMHTASRDPRLIRVLDRVGGDPYATTVVTRTADTPDPAQTYADLLTDKIIGEIITHIVSDEVLWEDATRTWDAVGAGIHWDTVVIGDVT